MTLAIVDFNFVVDGSVASMMTQLVKMLSVYADRTVKRRQSRGMVNPACRVTMATPNGIGMLFICISMERQV